jgi:hypothetical protein
MAPKLPRPTFRLDLKFLVSRSDGTRDIVWMHYPGVFSGRSVVCALAEATEAACEEVRRISKRPAYDLMLHIGAEYHLLNVDFIRADVEDEDHDAIAQGPGPEGGISFGGNAARVPR